MKYSLLIGRWQPFHEGHRALVQSVIDEGKMPYIGIRDTETSEENPYSIEQRRAMIEQCFPGVPTMVVPDIEEIVYGRKVGYAIREVKLHGDIEAISGTKIRAGIL